jgi:predicted RNase H-like HicB family nuclease
MIAKTMMNLLNRFRRPPTLKVTVQVTVFVEPDEGGFHAFNPAFKGLHTDGATEEDAVLSFVKAVPAYVQSLVRHGDPVPVGLMKVEQHTHAGEPEIPIGAFLRHVEMSWPSAQTSGIS